ncbi:hypothetical protein GGI03_003351 [Coemansia sp. RSA 2337]|nr:hypothetical protein LPJ71_003338 [Coemansia sp. S17]KAJ2020502.1 hypothetical protein GGI14_000800 [Coemansia sp. S680]KAJ2033302.1 hypothetical protein H4S03_005742 [Coemansia sp. S3946]KAJ2050444.1 hypothetical protein H4S04_002600 [Coemansia sp. S16]KAJ2084372.1 hypothetical protein GGI09_007266 [Coemansia sp. S100]KAJ2084983.1 hypothetical protein GGI16_006913 [Coemansia sp. S142-1]KAJ2117375.1 hypothetical protein IW146_000786 [Coemansia sp. RSA 922]KAJ2464238.1 hypothetical protein
MSAPPASLVPALAESLDALESHQQILLGGLRAIHTRLSQGDGVEDELLPTLTFYINQANLVQRKMMLIQARVSDMKRRADRLKAHRAKQDQMVAEWMAQERARPVPAAQASPALAQVRALGPMSRHDSTSLPPSPMPDSGEQVGSRSVPVLRSLPESLAGRRAESEGIEPGIAVLELPPSVSAVLTTGSVDRGSSGLGIESPSRRLATSVISRPVTPVAIATTAAVAGMDPSNTSSADSVLAVTTIKRKGKRRVRVPTIE